MTAKLVSQLEQRPQGWRLYAPLQLADVRPAAPRVVPEPFLGKPLALSQPPDHTPERLFKAGWTLPPTSLHRQNLAGCAR